MGSCRRTKDHERKRVQREKQCALAMEKSISQDVLATLVSIENHMDRRWRKCIIVVDNLSNFLHDVAHNFNDEDKQQVPRRFLDKETIRDLLPKFARHAKDIEQKLNLLECMEDAYAQLVVQKEKDNLPYRNVLLTAMVSHQSGPFQHYIFQTIGGSIYLLSKAITQKIHVDLIGDNIWGRLPWKR
jgi:hypothetical protein